MTCFESPSRYYLSAGSYVKGRQGERNFRLTKRERSKKVLSPQRGRQTIHRISTRTENPNLYISYAGRCSLSNETDYLLTDGYS